MNHEYLDTSIWYKEVITDPYQVVASFFDYANVSVYRNDIMGILNAACSHYVWNKTSPFDLLHRIEKFEAVVNAAFVINQEKKKSPLTINPHEIFNPNLYYGWHANYSEWDYFPRMLSFNEYVNPYLAIRMFFKRKKIKEWKKIMQDLLQYALSKESIFDSGESIDSLCLYRYFVTLIEAVHLIDVREINHIDGRIKNRTKTR